MKNLQYILWLFILLSCSTQKDDIPFEGKTQEIQSKEGLKITMDTYIVSKDAPYILLFHQANFSRGAYREIAPKLNKLGFNCIAIDQRSGEEVNGVLNQTYLEAKKMGKNTEYVDALEDIEAIFQYTQNKLKAKKILLWGSSYSASLVLYMASKYKNQIKGVLSFSPGEYFRLKGKRIEAYASQITCPVFITSAQNEQKEWQAIYDKINAPKTSFLPLQEGYHGSKALWEDKEENEAYWKAVKEFLNELNK